MSIPKKFAVVDKQGVVTGIIVWDPEHAPQYQNPDGLVELHPDENTAEIGGSFDGEVFTRAAVVGLDQYKDRCTATLEADYKRLSSSLFVSAVDGERMRIAAVTGAKQLRAATTQQEVDDAVNDAVAAMEARSREAQI